MRPYSKKDVESIYLDLVKSSKDNFEKCRFKESLQDIVTAARWAYNFNFIYTDPKVENLIKSIAKQSIPSQLINSPANDYCVLIDSFLLDNRGLSQQYLRAMMANHMHILVVYTAVGGRIGAETLAELNKYDRASVLSLDDDIDPITLSRKIVDEVIKFSPGHIFLHLKPWDVVAMMVCYSINGVKKYQINLTDHAFWLGSSFIDYNIEYRPCGMTVSLEKRGLRESQIIHYPYYSINPVTSNFRGIPELPDGAIKIFTGGSVYKMLGADGMFFFIMDRLLDIHPLIYILVAGFDNNSQFEKYHITMKNADRVIIIGIRDDIDAVFNHIDIYLNTYPIGGGLMMYYAAKYGKPILAYREPDNIMIAIEGIVNPDSKPEVSAKSFTDLNKMIAYANRLIKDKDFYNNESIALRGILMSPDQFNSLFYRLINGEILKRGWEKIKDVNYDSFFEDYLKRENTSGFKATVSLLRQQKIRAFFKIHGYKLHFMNVLFLELKSIKLSRLTKWMLGK